MSEKQFLKAMKLLESSVNNNLSAYFSKEEVLKILKINEKELYEYESGVLKKVENNGHAGKCGELYTGYFIAEFPVDHNSVPANFYN